MNFARSRPLSFSSKTYQVLIYPKIITVKDENVIKFKEVKLYFAKLFGLAKSKTARDTYVVFAENVASAFLGFLFTLFVARALSVSEFGVFSAANNLIIILTSLTDIGISSGIVNYVASALARGKREEAEKYIKAGFVIRTITTVFLSVIILIFSKYISSKLLATDNIVIAWWVSLIALLFMIPTFLPYVLQGEKKFLKSSLVDLFMMLPKAFLPLLFIFSGGLTINKVFLCFVIALIISSATVFKFVGIKFFKEKPDRSIYRELIKFAGWLGVNRIVSSISGRLDIQMLAVMVGATATGLYSIPSRLASFIIVLASSFSAVLAPRMASFGSKEEVKKYILKASLAIIPVIAGIIFWIIIAYPFMNLLFGQKYISSVPVFKALAIAQIPFIICVPPVAAIIYAMRKTVYIGAFSFFQLIAIFLMNYIFIPKYGPLGPTITFGVVNSILALYSWFIVIKFYWVKEK